MSFFKNVSNFLFSGNITLAEETVSSVIMSQITEGSLADVSRFLSQPNDEILKTFEYSQYQTLLNMCVKKQDSEGALILFTEFVSQECGVNPKLIINWKSNKEFVNWFNAHVAKKTDMPAVPPSNSYWTMFDYNQFIGADLQDTITWDKFLRGNGVSGTDRENTYGQLPGTDATGSLDKADDNVKNAVSRASGETSVAHSPDQKTDDEQTSGIDPNQMYKDKWSQEVGRTHSDREADQDKIRAARLSKYGTTSMPKKVPSQNGGGRRTKYSNSDEMNWASKFNGLKLSNKLPAGVKNPNDLKDWFEKNGQ